jgi:amino acid transporter
VFSVAAHDPRPQSVALAASVGYSLFAIALLALASRDWLAPREQRIGLVLASLFPAAWAGASVLVISAIGPLASWTAGLWRCGVVGLAYLPVLVWLGRGVGLRSLARVWLAERRPA